MSLAIGLSGNALAQNPSLAKEAMSKLDAWVGNWEGEGWQMDQSGKRNEFKVYETVESKLNGLAIQVEGKGEGSNGYIGHNAIGLIYFDSKEKIYRFNSITQDGNSTISELKVNEKGEFIWGFEVPGGEVRFTIEITTDAWVEKGEYGSGGSWFPFLEIKLSKVK